MTDVLIPYIAAEVIELVRWIVSDGTYVQEGDPICELHIIQVFNTTPDNEYDFILEMDSPISGRIKQRAQLGSTLKPDDLIATIQSVE
ncbi:hypothetical protein GC197_18385 [bacterium]|nr:hypothetical protein [bacterium]